MPFPTISRRPDDVKIIPINPAVRSRYQQGSGVFRSKYTASKTRIEIHWAIVYESEKDSILSHFESNAGSSFTFTEPISSDSYTNMIYADDQLEFVYLSRNGIIVPNYYEFTLNLIEV